MTSRGRRPTRSDFYVCQAFVPPGQAAASNDSARWAKTKATLRFGSKLSELAIFSLPALAQIGTITGLVQPHGLCSDDKGNVGDEHRIAANFRVRSRRRQSHQRLERPDRIPVRLRRRPAPQ